LSLKSDKCTSTNMNVKGWYEWKRVRARQESSPLVLPAQFRLLAVCKGNCSQFEISIWQSERFWLWCLLNSCYEPVLINMNIFYLFSDCRGHFSRWWEACQVFTRSWVFCGKIRDSVNPCSDSALNTVTYTSCLVSYNANDNPQRMNNLTANRLGEIMSCRHYFKWL